MENIMQFIPYEESRKLDSLNFNEECIVFWTTNPKYAGEPIQLCTTDALHGYNLSSASFKKDFLRDGEFLALTWQQCWDFFEDEYKLYSSQDNILLDFCVTSADKEIKILKPLHTGEHFKNRDEVRLERLRYLIKTVENGRD